MVSAFRGVLGHSDGLAPSAGLEMAVSRSVQQNPRRAVVELTSLEETGALPQYGRSCRVR